MNTRAKLRYIWDYYKYPIIIAMIVVIAVVSFIRGRLAYKPTVFNLVMIDSNVSELADRTLLDDFRESCSDFDPDKEKITLNANYDTSTMDQGMYSEKQKLLIEYNVGSIDATIGPKDIMEELAEGQAFVDLNDLLPEELMARIRDENIEILTAHYEDPATGKKYDFPAAINISGSEAIKKGFTDIYGETFPYFDEDCYYAVSPNSSYLDHGIEFLKYLLEK
ncbi:MAG: hypothetical protein K6G42_05125 [Lachnospiraceae bacterium]|nr:hypothetical protein [Lachnospiraceae bacterium]